MQESHDMLNPLVGWSNLYGYMELGILCDMMMAQLQCKFREQVERRHIFDDQQASPTAGIRQLPSLAAFG